ncbi:WD domain-containing protein [Zalerion maritima]|uniref:WD domain-containing protein n=1 Tax=Zalerion maritima TaxID=339359 RepID=A0AAD5WNG5_9PEZI|nr:WD domain-containing protein [Zalerion maritima]
MVDVERLDSDRVMFLIWRFLLESNYRESAAKLQKEWQVAQPHRDFDWARFVKTHALVSLLQRGLQHQAYEREFLAGEVSQDSAADVSEERIPFGVFGRLVTEPAPTYDEDDEEDEDEDEEDFEIMDDADHEIHRKRPGNDRRRSSPAKRQRLINGYVNGVADAATTMDVDQVGENGNGHAYPSPLEGEQAPTPIPRTDGPAVSTQADAVRNLTDETTFLQLSNEDPSEETATNLPLVMHCSWNPQDPTLLAAAGSDTLARVWTISPPSPHEHVAAHVNPASELLLANRNIPHNADVTAMAWNHEGGQIAIATQFDGRAKVTVYDLNSAVIRDWDLPEPPVIKMKWNTEDTFILTISPDIKGALISVFPINDDKPEPPSHFLQHDLEKEPPDVAWCTETDFVVCGGNMLRSLHYADGRIAVSRKYETREDDEFCHIRYDAVLKLVATGSEKGEIDIWQHDGQRQTIKAHQGPVTSLAWQPSQEGVDSPGLVASAGEDGIIAIWDARRPDAKPVYSMSVGCPVVALSFTPDGTFIAAATTQGVLVYKVGDTVLPFARWSRMPHPGWLSPKAATEGPEEDIHLLCWDSNGHKLAYGVNSRLAVINFITSPPSEAIEL